MGISKECKNCESFMGDGLSWECRIDRGELPFQHTYCSGYINYAPKCPFFDDSGDPWEQGYDWDDDLHRWVEVK